jgi:PAS domain S-box-containing protein
MVSQVSQIPIEGYQAIFKNSPVAMLLMDVDVPVLTILDVNEAYLSSTNTTRESVVGKSIFAAFPVNPTDQYSRTIEQAIVAFEQVLNTKAPNTRSNYRYDMRIRGTDEFEECYWTTTITPVLDELGNVKYFIHSPQNVTELYKAREREKAGAVALSRQRQQLYSTFMQAPVGIVIFKGPGYIVELINPLLCELYGTTVDELIGKNVFEVLPYTKGVGFEELIDNVRLTGVPFKGEALATPLLRNGKVETAYLNIVYQPLRENDGSISGVIVAATDVTEQVNAKKAIEEAEERARLAVDAIGLGTYDINLITGDTVTSEQFAHIFGFESIITRSEYLERFHEDDQEIRVKALEEALVKGKLLYEARIVWPDKSIRWVRVEGKVYYDEQWKAHRAIGTVLDITEQKKARAEQQKLITLVSNSVDLMSILNLDGSNSYINEAGRNLMGYTTDEEVSSVSLIDLHAPEMMDFLHKSVIPTVMEKGSWSGKMLMRNLQSNEIFPVYKNTIRIDDPVNGQPINFGVVARDMRPELAAKQALANSEELLRNITSAAPTGLWMSDEHGATTYVNQSWIDWTGIPYEEHMGTGWLKSIAEEDREMTRQKFLKDTADRKLYEVEFRINHSDGTIHWCVTTGKPQYCTNGNFLGYIGACVDITEQKNLQQQKDDFIGVASHELKTPVTSIKAYTQVLERMLKKNGETKEAEMIKRMDGQVNRLTSLIGDLLDVTKINSGRLQFNDREFDFNSFVKELIEDLQRTSEKHRLLENLAETGVVFSDKERIGQVITNLITNAVKYSPNSDKIIIHTSLKNDEINLCVQDFGIGISKDKLDKVFEQFYRVSGNMQHTFPGLGLGLYISSEIIKREGGRIWVSSVEGEGSSFCFSLPLKKTLEKL